MQAALTLRGAEREYRLSRITLRRAIARGELPAWRPGTRRILVLRRDLEAWLARHPVEAAVRELRESQEGAGP